MGEGPPCCLGLCCRCCYTCCQGRLLKFVAVITMVSGILWTVVWTGVIPDTIHDPSYWVYVIMGVILPCLCFAGGGAACAGVCSEERAKSDQAGCRGLCCSGCYTALVGLPLKLITVLLFIVALIFTYVYPALAVGAIIAMAGWGDYSGDVVAALLGWEYYIGVMIGGVFLSCLLFTGGSTACAAVCDEERKLSDVPGCRGLCCGCCYNKITGGSLKLVACLTLFIAGVWTYIWPIIFGHMILSPYEEDTSWLWNVMFESVYILILVMTITSCCLFVCVDAACAAVCAEERASLLPVVAEPPAAIVQVTPEATVVEMPAVISEPPTEAAVEEVAAVELTDVTQDPPPDAPGLICVC